MTVVRDDQNAGEQALLAQIKELQGKLADCLDTEKEPEKEGEWGEYEWQREYDKKLLAATENIADNRPEVYDYIYFLKQAFKVFVASETFAQSTMKSEYAEMYSDLLSFFKECEEAQEILKKNWPDDDGE